MSADAVTGTLAVTTASAPPARGDPPITEGAGGGIGTGGGADPPGGITDAPPPEIPNTDGSWTATVGGTEFAGLTEADVGRVLWRGERVNGRDPDEGGYCEEFPSMEFAGVTRWETGQRIESEVEIALDADECTVTLAGITKTISEDLLAGVWQRGHPTWRGVVMPGFSNIAFTKTPAAPESPHSIRFPPTGVRSSRVDSWLKANDIIRFALTEVEINHTYDVAALRPLGFRVTCDADSPLVWLAWIMARAVPQLPNAYVQWVEDSCDRDREFRSNSIYMWGEGRFHVETLGFSLDRDVTHTSMAFLESWSDREEHRCRLTPSSVADARINYVRLGMRFHCHYLTLPVPPAN